MSLLIWTKGLDQSQTRILTFFLDPNCLMAFNSDFLFRLKMFEAWFVIGPN